MLGFEEMECAMVLLFRFAIGIPIWLALAVSGAEVMPPHPPRYFNDEAHVVSASTAERLNQTLEDFEKSNSSQIVVAIYPKMQSDSSVEDYTVRVARAWGAGQKAKNNGAILFIFLQDRKMRIEVGYGLEGALPDALAKRIIEEEIKPHFQRGDYDGGVTAGVNAILQSARGEYKGTGQTRSPVKSGNPWPSRIVFSFIAFAILAAMARRSASRGTIYGSSGRTPYWGGWAGGGWAGGGGGSGGSSGGGGGGFASGGGSFGGGGASGSW